MAYTATPEDRLLRDSHDITIQSDPLPQRDRDDKQHVVQRRLILCAQRWRNLLTLGEITARQ